MQGSLRAQSPYYAPTQAGKRLMIINGDCRRKTKPRYIWIILSAAEALRRVAARNGRVADGLDGAKAAFRAAGEAGCTGTHRRPHYLTKSTGRELWQWTQINRGPSATVRTVGWHSDRFQMRDKSVTLSFVVTVEAGDFFLDIFEDANSNKRRKLWRAQYAINDCR